MINSVSGPRKLKRAIYAQHLAARLHADPLHAIKKLREHPTVLKKILENFPDDIAAAMRDATELANSPSPVLREVGITKQQSIARFCGFTDNWMHSEDFQNLALPNGGYAIPNDFVLPDHSASQQQINSGPSRTASDMQANSADSNSSSHNSPSQETSPQDYKVLMDNSRPGTSQDLSYRNFMKVEMSNSNEYGFANVPMHSAVPRTPEFLNL